MTDVPLSPKDQLERINRVAEEYFLEKGISLNVRNSNSPVKVLKTAIKSMLSPKKTSVQDENIARVTSNPSTPRRLFDTKTTFSSSPKLLVDDENPFSPKRPFKTSTPSSPKSPFMKEKLFIQKQIESLESPRAKRKVETSLQKSIIQRKLENPVDPEDFIRRSIPRYDTEDDDKMEQFKQSLQAAFNPKAFHSLPNTPEKKTGAYETFTPMKQRKESRDIGREIDAINVKVWILQYLDRLQLAIQTKLAMKVRGEAILEYKLRKLRSLFDSVQRWPNLSESMKKECLRLIEVYQNKPLLDKSG